MTSAAANPGTGPGGLAEFLTGHPGPADMPLVHGEDRSATLGEHLLARLATVRSPLIREVRGKGLFIGIEVDPRRTDARTVVDRQLTRGLLSKDTHGTVVRFAPPLVIAKQEIDWAVEQVRAVFTELGEGMRRAA